MSQFAKDNNTFSASWQLYDAERMANERLRQQLADTESDVDTIAAHNIELQQQLAAANAEIERLKGMVDEIQSARHVLNEHNRLLTRLAASQAREQKLREALKPMIEGFYWLTHDNHVAAEQALSIPQDTFALDQLKAQVAHEAGEVMRHSVLNEHASSTDGEWQYLERRIRSLPSVTLEDLK